MDNENECGICCLPKNENWECPQCKKTHCDDCHSIILRTSKRCPYCRFDVPVDEIRRILSTSSSSIIEDLYTIMSLHELLVGMLDDYVTERMISFSQI